MCLVNEQQPNLPEHEDFSGWQRRKTRLQWLMWPSTQCIGKDTRASSYLFSRRAADVISEAYLNAMTGDRHDELAALDLSITPSWLVWVLTIFFIIPVLFCFVFEHETNTRVLAVIFFITVRKLAI